MILDGVMVILSTIFLTIWHPGHGFQGRWNEAGFRFRTSKVRGDQENPETVAVGGSGSSEKVEPNVSEAVTSGSQTTSHKG